ncbi:MAG: penicillin-binding transpeptidase domain-containing protein, partial [Pseudomonadota bacterium]
AVGPSTPGSDPVTSGEAVLSEATARDLIRMMRGVVEEGTGRRARLGAREAAGKTGTTQGARDAWFIGFTADYVAGVWMGNDDNTPLTGVTGGGLPAEIWRETMLRVHADLPPRALPAPARRIEGPLIALGGRDDARPREPRATGGEGGLFGVFREAIGGFIDSDPNARPERRDRPFGRSWDDPDVNPDR